MTIREAIERIVDQKLIMQVVSGTVEAVDLEKMTCTVNVKLAPKRFNVRLHAVTGFAGAGIEIVPKVGSLVLVAAIYNKPEESFVTQFTEVSLVRLKTDSGAELLVGGDGEILLNGDGFGGLVRNEDLLDNLNQLKTYSETLKNLIVTALDGIVPGTGLTLDQGMQAVAVNFKDMENSKVKH